MYFLSMDGGATKTRGVIFSETGEIRLFSQTEPTSLNRMDLDPVKLLGKLISHMVTEAHLGLEEVDSINLALAGISNMDARDRLFRELDKLRLSDRTMVSSDVESAYEVVWGDTAGALVCVGTGSICWARNKEGQTARAGGLGPLLGDEGGGYWMGKSAMVQLIMNESARDEELEAIRTKVMEVYQVTTFDAAARIAGESENQIQSLASLGRTICELADVGNEVALAIVQEGTQKLGEHLLEAIEEVDILSDRMEIGIQGSIIEKSDLYQRMMAQALSFDIPQVSWRSPFIDPAFGAGLIAARLNEIEIDMDALTHNWREGVPAKG